MVIVFSSQERCETFRRDAATRVFLATIGAGSEGLDLTAATVAVFLEWGAHVGGELFLRPGGGERKSSVDQDGAARAVVSCGKKEEKRYLSKLDGKKRWVGCLLEDVVNA